MLFKKRASYPSIVLLTLPLIAYAVEESNPVRQSTVMPAPLCAPLMNSLDQSARQLLDRFYQLRAGHPAWRAPEQRQQLREQLVQLIDDGLTPADYPVIDQDDDCAELQTSNSYLQALLHLRHGRLLPSRAEAIWHAPEHMPADPYQVVLSIASVQSDIAGVFAAMRPQLPQYSQLRHAYAAARRQQMTHWQSVPSGSLLKPQGNDYRVPLLRARLAAEGYLAIPGSPADIRFDSATVAALQSFQEHHGLQPDGILGPISLNELNIDAQTRREQLRANLERLRWIAGDLSQAKVVVNVAGAELHVIEHGEQTWRTRTQVGRPERLTPMLASSIVRLTLNPTWTVPPTILREDKLPAIRQDIAYLDQHEMSVYDRNGNRLDPEQIDWNRPGPILLRQAAGSQNPLGRVALRFDNPFSVYLHDTPSQTLFDKSPRFFSSGCVRVEAVDNLLARLLSPDELAIVQTRLASGKTQTYYLTSPASLLIAYWTVEVNSAGGLRYLPDIYSRDVSLIAALNAASRSPSSRLETAEPVESVVWK